MKRNELFESDSEPKNNSEHGPEAAYNFPDLERLKPGLELLVIKLKGKIESGEYSTLISDEARGRIPTLVLRKVFEEKAPNARELKTIFLAFGRSDRWDDELSKYIETHRDEWGKSLVVTEKINRGHTISAIQAQLDNAHYSDYDFASLYSDLKEEVIKEILADSQWRGFSGMKNRKSEHQGEVYTGGYSHDEIKHKYGGVKRRVINSLFWDENRDRVGDYSIGTHPERIDKLIEFPEPSPQTLEAQAELLGFYQMSSFPSRAQRDIEKGRLGELREKSDKQELSEEQKREIQDTINKARQDVDRLAHQIINDVWKSKEEDSV